jgi:hypothetical protein
MLKVALLAGIALLWSAALASAKTETFEVNYTGSGTLVSRTQSITSPQCGEVTETRNEDTHFSWVTTYRVTLHLGHSGLSGATAKKDAQSSPLVSNDSTVKLSDVGCQPGISDCNGKSEPQPGQSAVLDIPGAGSGGRSHVKVEAVGGFIGFQGKDFSGSWGFTGGSCAENNNKLPLLVPEFGVPAELQAVFPVSVSTFASLPRGHYFKIHINPGHYAPSHRDNCFQNDGCLKDDFSWNGSIRFTRLS